MSARRRKQEQSRDPTPAAPGRIAATKPLRPLSRRRKWLFRLTLIFVAPVLFLLALEGGLRVGGYGYPTAFFLGPDADGAYRPNLRFGWRFFPRRLARTPVSCLLSSKPVGTIRIFVLGSSAAQGVPDPSFSVGRVLQVLLRERYPEVKFEVVNTAMTAINSHVVREIARDCAAHQPDLFVVYMGNNEVVGPYGPGTVFQQSSPSLRLIRAGICLKSTRIGQLLTDAMGRIGSHSDAPTAWQGMGMFIGSQVAADDPRLPAVYSNFRANLIDVCRIAREAGAGVVLSTVAVNLKDCPPFASRHREDLTPDEMTNWRSIYEAGVRLEERMEWGEAIAKYEEAAKTDNRFADLAFRRGRCLAALARWEEARKQFALARDLDTLRFRADSWINGTIREVAGGQQSASVSLADAEKALASSGLAVGGISGDGLFYEHVHFTFDGSYLLARALLPEIEAALPRLADSRRQESILSREECAEALGLTPCDEYHIANLMTATLSEPPFTGQLDHAAHMDLIRKRAEKLGRVANTPTIIEASYRACEAAFGRTPDDWVCRHRLGKLALESGRPQTALEHLRAVAKEFPWDCEVNMNLASAARQCGKLDEAIGCLEKVLEVNPGTAAANYNLARLLDQQGRIEEAIVYYRQTLEAAPAFASAHSRLGEALERRGQLDEAIAAYRKAAEIMPEFAAAHFNLAAALEKNGEINEAITHFRRAVEIEPGSPQLHNDLGAILLRCQKFDEAIAHFRQALKIKADYREARENLEKTIEIRGRAGGKHQLR
jgi:tetratricopeptide (TPR) repeat protein